MQSKKVGANGYITIIYRSTFCTKLLTRLHGDDLLTKNISDAIIRGKVQVQRMLILEYSERSSKDALHKLQVKPYMNPCAAFNLTVITC